MSLFYAVNLFVTGVAMVFKTRIQWVFVSIGFLVFAYAGIRIFTAPWH